MTRRLVLVSSFLVACGGSSHTLYPLNEGHTCEYQVSISTMAHNAGFTPMKFDTRMTVTNMPQRDLNGKRVTPQRADISQQSQFTFMAEDNTGLYEYARQTAGAVEPEILSTPVYYLKSPLKAGATWDGETETSLLRRKISISTKVSVEAMQDIVTVPAGTFDDCVKTKTLGKGEEGRNGGGAKVTVEEHTLAVPWCRRGEDGQEGGKRPTVRDGLRATQRRAGLREEVTTSPNKRMQLTKPAQAMQLRS